MIMQLRTTFDLDTEPFADAPEPFIRFWSAGKVNKTGARTLRSARPFKIGGKPKLRAE
jgi:hypothetical protein